MEVPSEENFVVMARVIEGIAVIRARPMAAAIRPYSMAVAPDSSFRNLFIWKLQFIYSTCTLQAEASGPSLGEHVLKIPVTV